MSDGLLGRKIGMTSVYREGLQIPVTVIEVEPNPVVQVKSAEGSDGYDALQLAYGAKSQRQVNKPTSGHYKRANVNPRRVLHEFRGMTGRETGKEIRVEEIFAEGDLLSVRGTSKGRGFAGVIKRHKFHGHKGSHGTHESFRGPGSIGSNTSPGRVWPGQRMPGQYGNATVSVKNLEVIEVVADKNLLLVKGAVPGARNSIVELHKI
ncbi:MAG: 50S ribosomal protein L3 [bacterium]